MQNLLQLARLLRAACFRLSVTLGAALLLPAASHAIVGGSGVDPNSADSPWAGVGSVVNASGTFSGVLIAPGYVLTAAHAVASYINTPSAVTFQINAGTTTQIVADQIFLNSPYISADGFRHNDVAIVHLSNPAPASVPFYALYTQEPALHATMTFVGYGVGGDGVNGTSGGPDAAVKRIGRNNADYFLPAGAASHDIYLFDFDGPDNSTNLFGGQTLGANAEATFAAGDSGSPAFVNDNGAWKIAGINTFNGWIGNGPRPVAFGSIGGGMLISAQAEWINSVISAPVPEPESWMMLMAGLFGVGAMTRRRNRS